MSRTLLLLGAGQQSCLENDLMEDVPCEKFTELSDEFRAEAHGMHLLNKNQKMSRIQADVDTLDDKHRDHNGNMRRDTYVGQDYLYSDAHTLRKRDTILLNDGLTGMS